MAMPDKSHDSFTATLDRAKSLIALYRRLIKVRFVKEPKKFTHEDISDLVRSSVVLSVAAMDSYFTARFAELLVPYLKRHGAKDSLVVLLSNAGLDTRQALEMLQMDRPYRRIRWLMDSYFERYTTQRSDVIDSLFIAYGLKTFSCNVQRSVRRANLVHRVELLIERRHQIVHEGDLNAHNCLRDIDVDKVEGQLKDLKLFVDAAQALSGKRVQ